MRKEKTEEGKLAALLHAASQFSEGDLSKDSKTGTESPVGTPNMSGSAMARNEPAASPSTAQQQGQLPLFDKAVSNFGGSVNDFSNITKDLKIWLGAKINASTK